MSLAKQATPGKMRGSSSLSRAVYPAFRLILSVAVTFFGLLLVTFLIARVVPIDPVLAVVGERASPETYAAAVRQLGLDRPLYEQFAIYVGKVLRGDFGVSLLTAQPVISDIARVFPATLELATVATLLNRVYI